MSGSEFNDQQKREWDFVTNLINWNESYHNHKENMAYAAAVAYLAMLGAGLVHKEWPPQWFADDTKIKLIGLILLILSVHILVIRFLRWQLQNRTYAAILVAAGYRTLAKWTDAPGIENAAKSKNQPAEQSKQKQPKKIDGKMSQCIDFLKECFWIPSKITLKADVDYCIYPETFRKAIEEQINSGTGAVSHARFVFYVCWAVFVVFALKTVWPWKDSLLCIS